MNKIIIILISIFFTAFQSYSQDWDAVINNSEVYIHGVGHGNTVAEADIDALRVLSSNICIHVSGVTIDTTKNVVTNGDAETYKRLTSIIKAYTNITLHNTQRHVISQGPKVCTVGRWIKRTEVNKIFEHRKQKIKDYVKSGIDAINTGKIDVALKDCYWALALVNSLQEPNEAKYELIENDPQSAVTLIVWLPQQIRDILSNIKIDAVKRIDDEVDLFITYKDKPVTSLDYTYFDGSDFSYIYSAKDGKGIIELPPNDQSEHYQLNIEYEYRGQSQIDKDLEDALEVVPSLHIPNQIMVKSKPTNKREKKLESTNFSKIDPDDYARPNTVKNVSRYETTLNAIVSAITDRKYRQAESYFTPDCLDSYNRLIKYGKARIIGSPKYTFYPYRDCVIARGLKMSFSFSNGNRTFVENVVFSFNKEGKINNITFGLDNTLITDILCLKDWKESSRMAIVDFLENYQTAFALEKLDYIESIFDNDADIRTVTVIERPRRSTDGNGYTNNKILIENRYTKDSYIKKLRASFASKQYINLRFSDITVDKPGKGEEAYSIQISQEYYSSNYGDKGYLFLFVDLNSPDKPLIKIRTWQPEKDPEFGMYNYTDF